MRKKILTCLFVLICLQIFIFNHAHAATNDNLPDKVTLAANRMRYDSNTGDFLADGNVTITAGDFKITAPVGSGNIDKQILNFSKGITASGQWLGDKISLKSGNVSVSLSGIPTCKFNNGVSGGFGTMILEADKLTITGAGGFEKNSRNKNDTQTKFWLVNVDKLEDSSRGVTFSAGSVEGILKNGELHNMTAKNGVHLKGKPKGQNQTVTLKGDSALYSLSRGSIVVSGHVVATQGGRTLKSDSVVYFPDQNRVEALGGVSKKRNGSVQTGQAEITIDLRRERNN